MSRAAVEQKLRDANITVNDTTLKLMATALALELLSQRCASDSEKWKRFSLGARLWMARQDTFSGKAGAHIQYDALRYVFIGLPPYLFLSSSLLRFAPCSIDLA